MERKKRGNLHPDNSSLIINIQPVLNYRNIKHPMKFLIGIGINSASANKLLHGKAVQLNLKQLTAICINLNCTPDDIFALRDLTLKPKHALNKLKKHNSKTPNITEWLAEKTVEEVSELFKKEEKR